MRIGEKLISNTTYLFLDWVTLSFLSFVFWSILGKTLGTSELGVTSELGIISTSINFIILVTYFSTLGITLALQKLIPEIKKKKGIGNVRSLLRLSIRPIAISLIFISIIFFIFSNNLSVFLKIPYNVVLISIFSIVFYSLFAFFGSILYGFQNMRRYFLTDLFQILLRVFLSFFLIVIGFSYFGPLIAFCIGFLIILFFRINLNYFKKGSGLFSYKKLFDYAFPALISALATSFIFNSQFIILTVIKSTEITGIFTVAFIISSPILILPNVLTSALFPIISALSVDHKTKERQGYLIGLVLRYSLFLTIPLSLLLIIFSDYAVLLFSQQEFLPSTQYFPMLILGSIFYGIGSIFISNLYAIGKPKLYRNIMFLSSLLFLSSSLILTNYFSALGLSFSYLAVTVIYFLLCFNYIKKYLKIKLFVRDISKILLSSLLIISILLILKPFIYDAFVLPIFLVPIGLFHLYLLSLIKFYRAEDAKVLEFFGKKIPIIGKYFLTVAGFIRKRL